MLKCLACGPLNGVDVWHTYLVNGYKFQTISKCHGKKTNNCGVYVRGLSGGGEDDFYGELENIYELEYSLLGKVVLFYCNWFDPSSRGTRLTRHNIVEIRKDRSYGCFDPFFIAQNVRQVYYVPYPNPRREKRGWHVAIVTKPRGRVEIDIPDEDLPYQMEEMSLLHADIEVDTITGLRDSHHDEDEEVDPSNILPNRVIDEVDEEDEDEIEESEDDDDNEDVDDNEESEDNVTDSE